MIMKRRAYSALVVSSSEKFNASVEPLLLTAQCEPVVYAGSVASAKRKIVEKQFDFVIINAPLPDEQGEGLAIDVCSGKSTVCLLLVRADICGDIRERVCPCGVFTLAKPLSSSAVVNSLEFMTAARERLRSFEQRTVSIEEKMEEIRLVNRAKWLLIDNLKMTEPDAHRYIEKQAMDRCVTRREISKEIISTYA